MAFRSCFGVSLLVRCVDCYATTTITRTRARNTNLAKRMQIDICPSLKFLCKRYVATSSKIRMSRLVEP